MKPGPARRPFLTVTNLLIAALLCGLAGMTAVHVKLRSELKGLRTRAPRTAAPQPYRDEIRAIIDPLTYTALPTLTNAPVRISIDFEKNTWGFHDFRKFDDAGNLILDEGHTGICGELTAYAYQKIRPIVDKTHELKFIQVSRSDFFKYPQGGHLALLLVGRNPPHRKWIVDPSFDVYERAEDLIEDYAFYQVFDRLDFLERRITSISYPVDGFMPIVIDRDYVVDMAIMKVDGRFDPFNHGLALYVVRAGKYAGKRVLEVRVKDARREIIEDVALAEKTMGRKEFEKFRARLIALFDRIEIVQASRLP